RPAAPLVQHPSPWQRPARPQAFAPVSRQRSSRLNPLQTALIAFASVQPQQQPPPRGWPVTSPPAWPCPAAQACCRQGSLAAGAPAGSGLPGARGGRPDVTAPRGRTRPVEKAVCLAYTLAARG